MFGGGSTNRPSPMGGGKGGGIGEQISDKGNEISDLEVKVKDTASDVSSTLGNSNGSTDFGRPNTMMPGKPRPGMGK